MMMLTSCGGDYRTETGNILHPVPDTIPYHDHDHIPVDTTRFIEELEDVPAPFALLAEYLDDPEGHTAQKLDVYVSSAVRFNVESFDDDRLVMLDRREYRLLEYDLRADEFVELAEVGEGPGDLLLTQDMVRRGNAIYLPMENLRVSRFDCSASPCGYDDTVPLEIMPWSAAPVDDSTIAVLADTPYLSADQELPGPEDYEDVVRLVNFDGEVYLAFGSAYRSEAYLVNHMFIRYGSLRYSEGAGRFIVLYRDLPNLYTYDDTGQFHASYAFDAEVEPVHEFGTIEGYPDARRWADRDVNRSYYLLSIVDGLALVKRMASQVVDGKEATMTFEHDYFLIDLQSETSYHVGKDTYEAIHGRIIFPTDSGLVVNDGGALHFIGL